MLWFIQDSKKENYSRLKKFDLLTTISFYRDKLVVIRISTSVLKEHLLISLVVDSM